MASTERGAYTFSVTVRAASYRWERQVDRRGNETMCKVLVPAVTREVERQVQVAPASRVARVIPAEIRTVNQTVQIAPASTQRVWVAPSYGTVERTVVVRPATERVVERPAVIAVAEQQVLVRKSTTHWQRSSGGWFH